MEKNIDGKDLSVIFSYSIGLQNAYPNLCRVQYDTNTLYIRGERKHHGLLKLQNKKRSM